MVFFLFELFSTNHFAVEEIYSNFTRYKQINNYDFVKINICRVEKK